MHPRKPTKPQRPQQGNRPQHWRHYCPPYYYDWYEWDDYYNYYDYYDWDEEYVSANKSKPSGPIRPGPVKTAESIDTWTAYQQGFKDGWMAAMDYVMYGVVQAEDPTPPPMPTPPMPPKPIEGANE